MKSNKIKKLAMLLVMFLATGLFFGVGRAEPGVFLIPVEPFIFAGVEHGLSAVFSKAKPLVDDGLGHWKFVVRSRDPETLLFLLAVADTDEMCRHFRSCQRLGTVPIIGKHPIGQTNPDGPCVTCFSNAGPPLCILARHKVEKKVEQAGWTLRRFSVEPGGTSGYQVVRQAGAGNAVAFRFQTKLPYFGVVKSYKIELAFELPV
ncbi:MAG: hypothetical protein LBJ38_01560 [Oscillospiraceae bacterium]|jgi:hypothetical protein|nr:hypothetical protein [Oscillospiraceae bacterium]